MLWLWIVLAVVGAWVLIATVLAVLIGRAAHIGEVKYQDEMFLRRAARSGSVSSAA
jgi:hypothetical protein